MNGAFWRRLHNDERGQLIPLFMLGIMTLVFLVTMIINTGRQMNDKTLAQNGADAVVITHANWIARSLNVISMNNAAITQAFSTAVLAAALASISGESGAETFSRKARQSLEAAFALERMNRIIVGQFPAFSAGIAGSIAARNGVDAPILYAGFDDPTYYTGYRKKKETRFNSTPLPVEEVTLQGPPYLCITGVSGTPGQPNPDLNWNFGQYGYPPDTGPFTWGRQQVATNIKDLLLQLQFLSTVDDIWEDGCESRSLFGERPLSLYRIKGPPPATGRLGGMRNRWSVIAFTRYRRSGAAVLPSRFTNPPGAKYGLAQAEIYNDAGYDLYSQEWRAKLVPARLLAGEHRGRILDAVRGVPKKSGYPKLHEFLAQVSPGDLEEYVAH